MSVFPGQRPGRWAAAGVKASEGRRDEAVLAPGCKLWEWEGRCSPTEEIRAPRSPEKPATGLCPSQERLPHLGGREAGGQVNM